MLLIVSIPQTKYALAIIKDNKCKVYYRDWDIFISCFKTSIVDDFWYKQVEFSCRAKSLFQINKMYTISAGFNIQL